jgi:hypothetical protein
MGTTCFDLAYPQGSDRARVLCAPPVKSGPAIPSGSTGFCCNKPSKKTKSEALGWTLLQRFVVQVVGPSGSHGGESPARVPHTAWINFPGPGACAILSEEKTTRTQSVTCGTRLTETTTEGKHGRKCMTARWDPRGSTVERTPANSDTNVLGSADRLAARVQARRAGKRSWIGGLRGKKARWADLAPQVRLSPIFLLVLFTFYLNFRFEVEFKFVCGHYPQIECTI